MTTPAPADHSMVLELVKIAVPTIISLVALYFTFEDRRPKLILKERKGEWYKLVVTEGVKRVLFRGMIEVYNPSSRTNAIRDYRFWCKRPGTNKWELMESEHTTEGNPKGETKFVYNQTPFAIPPSSGAEVRLLASTVLPLPPEMPIRIEIEDLYEKKYEIEVTATP